ncbi:hypothetical protein Ancab_026533 [Ancistrocladus abbreviatus]
MFSRGCSGGILLGGSLSMQGRKEAVEMSISKSAKLKPLIVKHHMTAEHKDKHNGNEAKYQVVNGSFNLSRYMHMAIDLTLVGLLLALVLSSFEFRCFISQLAFWLPCVFHPGDGDIAVV